MVLKICESERGIVERICKAWENVRCLPSMIIHCVFHKQVLLGKISNLILCSQINNVSNDFHLFSWTWPSSVHEFLSKTGIDYPHLPYYIGFWWVRSSKVLLFFFFFEVRAKTEIFLNNQIFPQLLLFNTEFQKLQKN